MILVAEETETVNIKYGPDYCGLGKSIFRKQQVLFITDKDRNISDIISSLGWDIGNHGCDVYAIKGYKRIVEGKYSVKTMSGTLTIKKQTK